MDKTTLEIRKVNRIKNIKPVTTRKRSYFYVHRKFFLKLFLVLLFIVLVSLLVYFVIFPAIFLGQAKDALGKKRYELAEKNFQRVLAVQTDNLEAHKGLLIVYLNTDKMDKALAQINKIRELEPENFKILYMVADKLFQKGNYTEAIANYKFILEKGPKDYPACLGIGKSYREISDYDNSIKWFTEALKIKLTENQKKGLENEIALTYLEEGKEYFEIKEYEKAKKSFEEAEKHSSEADIVSETSKYLSKIDGLTADIPTIPETPYIYETPGHTYVPPPATPPPEPTQPPSNIDELMW